MADTLGGVIDKLLTADLKMWNNQEILYKIRRMSFDEFKVEYFEDENGAEKLWAVLKKACDLNVQRNQLIDEIDDMIIKMIKDNAAGIELDDGKYKQAKHKTY